MDCLCLNQSACNTTNLVRRPDKPVSRQSSPRLPSFDGIITSWVTCLWAAVLPHRLGNDGRAGVDNQNASCSRTTGWTEVEYCTFSIQLQMALLARCVDTHLVNQFCICLEHKLWTHAKVFVHRRSGENTYFAELD